MILDEIVVHDFGLYADRQKIGLTPPSPDKPITLFGGLNGHGKTTLLDALQLCLYGPFAKISNRNELSYQDYLSRCLRRGSATKEAAIEIAFRHTVDGKENRYRLHRSWRMRKSGCKEYFEVLKNRQRDVKLAENWISHIEDLIPVNISNLFLFDGEQIENYASPDNSMQLVGTAIRNLLGLDIVDQLEKDLLTYSRRKRVEDKTDPKRHEIEKEEAHLKELRARASNLKQEQAALKTTSIAPACKTLLIIEEEYRKLGGELYDHRMNIERDLGTAESILEESAHRLRGFAAADLPLLLVRDLLEEMRIQDQQEEESRWSQQVAVLLENRDEELLHQMHLNGVNHSAVCALRSYLEGDRNQHKRLAERESVLNLLPEIRGDLHILLYHRFDELIKSVVLEAESFEKAGKQAEDARLMYSSIPSDDVILEVMDRRETLIGEISALEMKYAGIQDELDQLARQIERSEQALLHLIESDIQAEGERQDRVRILHHANRMRTTLDIFRGAVIARHVRRIGHLVFESYQQLLRKTSLVTRLEIDPETFALTLYGRDGQVLSAERLSAGERQLLAIALLWGLAKASGRALPTAIDTPLGRLDAGHREFLVERYFPFASHQVLLLSTDEEISGRYLEALRPFIGRSYFLCYDDAEGSTRIVEGYFDQMEAA